MNEELMFSSRSNEWETPEEIFRMLDREFGFNLDPCATKENAKCETFYTLEDDGLKQDWGGRRVFVNPPYGNAIGNWVKKAYEESKKHKTTVVMLIPARTDTKYWHEYVFQYAKEIRFMEGRIKFRNGEVKNSAPFPSAVVVFYNGHEQQIITTIPKHKRGSINGPRHKRD